MALHRLPERQGNPLWPGLRGVLLRLGVVLVAASGLSASAPVLPTATEVIAQVLEEDGFTQKVAAYHQAYESLRSAAESEEEEGPEEAEETEFQPAPPSLVAVLNQVHALADQLAGRALAQWRDDWIGMGGDAKAMVALEEEVRERLADAVDDVTLEPVQDDLN